MKFRDFIVDFEGMINEEKQKSWKNAIFLKDFTFKCYPSIFGRNKLNSGNHENNLIFFFAFFEK